MALCGWRDSGQENNVAQSKTHKWLGSPSPSHCYRFSPFNCWTVELYCSLIKGITPKIRMLCFVLINSVLLKMLCVWDSEVQDPTNSSCLSIGEEEMDSGGSSIQGNLSPLFFRRPQRQERALLVCTVFDVTNSDNTCVDPTAKTQNWRTVMTIQRLTVAKRVSRLGSAVRRWDGKRKDRFDSASALLSLQTLWSVDTVLWLCPSRGMKH